MVGIGERKIRECWVGGRPRSEGAVCLWRSLFPVMRLLRKETLTSRLLVVEHLVS